MTELSKNTLLKALGLSDNWENAVRKNIHGEIIPDYVPLQIGEDFRFIPNCPRYIVTTHGNIYNILTGRKLKITPHKTSKANTNYVIFNVCLKDFNGNQTTFYVHRLVAEAFCTKPEGIPEESIVVNHIDGNTANNMASNLEWITRSDNSKVKLHTKWPGTVHELIKIREQYDTKSKEYFTISAKISRLKKEGRY